MLSFLLINGQYIPWEKDLYIQDKCETKENMILTAVKLLTLAAFLWDTLSTVYKLYLGAFLTELT